MEKKWQKWNINIYLCYSEEKWTANIPNCEPLHWLFTSTFRSDTDSNVQILLLLFSCYIMSDSLQPRGLQHTRLLCPSLSPKVCSNSSPLSQWCHPTVSSSSPSPPALNPSQHQGLSQRAGSLLQVAKVLEVHLQHQSFQWIFRVDFFRIV